MNEHSSTVADTLRAIGAEVFERGWLSSNNILFRDGLEGRPTLIDTGYASHAEQTVALVQTSLGHDRLAAVVNTHLHSDHAGGNAMLQRAWRCDIHVPVPSFDAAARWDREALTYEATGQRCDRFVPTGAFDAGGTLVLGGRPWQTFAAGGHDDQALMFFEPIERVLISGDALWERRLAIVFPELEGLPGFEAASRTLDLIESLQPSLVIPGHGPAFVDIDAAIAASRMRLAAYADAPERHLDYAARALTMFHMLEHGARSLDEVAGWLQATAVFRSIEHQRRTWAQRATTPSLKTEEPIAKPQTDAAREVLDRLVRDGVLVLRDGLLEPPPSNANPRRQRK